MQLHFLCLLALVFAATAANAAGGPIQLHYQDRRNHSVWQYASYGECIPIDKPGNLHLNMIIYSTLTTCQHYQDAECKKKSPFSPNIHRPGANVPARNYGFGKCHPVNG
jgi:hypothetical protein